MFITKDARHLAVEYQPALASLVPHAKELTHNGARYISLPNEPDEARLCRNPGIAIPAPVLTRYDWAAGKPWDILTHWQRLPPPSWRA
jgi:hypothetical protein